MVNGQSRVTGKHWHTRHKNGQSRVTGKHWHTRHKNGQSRVTGNIGTQDIRMDNPESLVTLAHKT